MSFRLNVTKKAHNRYLNKDFSCTLYYLFFFRMSVLKSQAYLTSSKSASWMVSSLLALLAPAC